MKSHCFLEVILLLMYFDFCIIMINDKRIATFCTYKISNPAVNGIIFSLANNTKYSVPS